MAVMLPPTTNVMRPDEAMLVPVLSALARPPLFDTIIEAQQEDPAITRDATRWSRLQEVQNPTPDEINFLERNRLTDKGFWRKDVAQQKWRLQVPTALRSRVMWEYHDASLAGHPGTDETIRSIQELFFWPGMNREIRRYVAGCHLCIYCKPVRGRQPDHQCPRPAKRAWDTVAVDLMGPYPHTYQGHRFILVVTDLFTRWVEAFPLRASDAPKIIQKLEGEVFCRFGYPRRILSDNGPQFAGHVWAEASRRWGCELWTTPVYHPRTNPTERRNQELKKGLRLRLHQGNQRTWCKHLPDLLSGLRRRRNAATGFTPSHILLGKTILRPGEWNLKQVTDEPNGKNERHDRDEEARLRQAEYQARYAAAPTPPRFYPGDWVYVPNQHLSNKAAGFNAKLAPARLGPFQIQDHIAGEVYWVWKDNVAQKVHGSTLIIAPVQTMEVPDGAPQEANEWLQNKPGAAEQARPTQKAYAESVDGEDDDYPDETVDGEEKGDDSSSHRSNENFVEGVDGEEDVYLTGRRPNSHGAAVKAGASPLVYSRHRFIQGCCEAP